VSVSKRIRYEILRRDENACQYCGSMAPDVALTIDHVIPVALGGSDDPSNLVAACRDCNAGKASVSPDSPIIAAVSNRSAEFALAQANVAAHIKADMEAIRDYRDEFEGAWNAWGRDVGDKRVTIPLPPDWKRSIAGWWRMAVPIELLLESIPTAMTSRGRNQTGIADADRFRYFAGIIWRTLEDYDATYPVGSHSGRVYSGDEQDEYGAQQWLEGYQLAEQRGSEALLRAAYRVFTTYQNNRSACDHLRHHIDGTTPPQIDESTLGQLAGIA
jgi:HNH endonuclease